MTSERSETLILDRLATPLGQALMVCDEQGVLCAFDWASHEDRMHAGLLRRARRSQLQPAEAPHRLKAAFEAYFDGDLRALETLDCRVRGTAFQEKVWAALRDIPPGETLSYRALAATIGAPAAVRAVGLANGSNPISIVVPCHRVIGSDGRLSGYAGGVERKRWLLAHEGATFRGT